MISAISSVEKYDLANTVTIIVNRFSVSMSVSFRLFIKTKKRKSVFDLVRFSISKSFDVVFFSTFSDVVFFSIFSTFFDALFVSSILLSVVFSSIRFFVSFSNDYLDSLSVFRFRFLSKVLQKRFHVSFHFSINLKKMWNIFQTFERFRFDSENCWNLFNFDMNQTKILCLFASQCRIAIENCCVFSALNMIWFVEKIIEKSANVVKFRMRRANRYVFEFVTIFFC